MANERLGQTFVRLWGRLNMIRPPPYLLYKAMYCNSQSCHEAVPEQGDKAHRQVLIQDQSRESRVLGRVLGNRRTKKPGIDLGTDCVIKWSWRKLYFKDLLGNGLRINVAAELDL